MTFWVDGYYARRMFKLVLDCPHQFGTWRARAWCRGYLAAKKEEQACLSYGWLSLAWDA